MITPKQQDIVLDILVNQLPPESQEYISVTTLCELTGLDRYGVNGVLSGMAREGLIGQYSGLSWHDNVDLHVTVRAHTFLSRGGYTMHERLIETELEHLKALLEKLRAKVPERDMLDVFNTLTNFSTLLVSAFK